VRERLPGARSKKNGGEGWTKTQAVKEAIERSRESNTGGGRINSSMNFWKKKEKPERARTCEQRKGVGSRVRLY